MKYRLALRKRRYIKEQADKAFNAIAPPAPDAEEEETYYKVSDNEGYFFGGCVLEISDQKTATIYCLWVEEPYRGKGIGFALLCAFESEAKKSGAFRMSVEPFDWNVGFYKRTVMKKSQGCLRIFRKDIPCTAWKNLFEERNIRSFLCVERT